MKKQDKDSFLAKMLILGLFGIGAFWIGLFLYAL